jgi:hypothetical protein
MRHCWLIAADPTRLPEYPVQMPSCRHLIRLLAALKTGCTLCLLPTAASENRSIHDAFNWSRNYLQRYHPDFATLQLLATSGSTRWQIGDAAGIPLLILPSDGGEAELRAIFHAFASLLLDTSRSRLSPETSRAIKDAWYWDARVQEQPAWLAFLSPWNPEGRLANLQERDAFWRLRWLMRIHGGRKAFWSAAQRAPVLLEQLRSDTPLTLEHHLDLLELASIKAIPVMNIGQSLGWLYAMDTFVFALEPKGAIQLLHVSQLQQPTHVPKVIDEARTRLDWIKRELPRINPAFHNAFHSLGLCFEYLLSGDHEAFTRTLPSYLEDRRFAETITQHIRNPSLTQKP